MNKENKTEETMGMRIRKQRNKLKMTQEQLAAEMYVTKGTISFYENDASDIKCSVLSELARILRTTPDYLLWGIEDNAGMAALEPDSARLLSAFENITDEKIKRLILAQVETALSL